VVLVLLLSFAVWHWWPRPLPIRDVKASGTIEGTEYQVGPKIPGRIVELPIEEGQEIRRGALLARLDTAELAAQVNQARAALENVVAHQTAALNGNRPEQIAQARAQAAAAEAAAAGAYAALVNSAAGYRKPTELKAQQDAAESHYRASEAAYQQAAAALRLVQEGARPQQIAAAQGAMAAARAGLGRAEDDASRMEALFRQGAISAQQWTAARTVRDVAQGQLQQAQAALADLRAGARADEIQGARMGLEQARANLEGARLALLSAREIHEDRLTAKTQLDAAQSAYHAEQARVRETRAQLDLLLAGTRPEDIRAAAAQSTQARAALAQAQDQLQNTAILAPVDAFVVTKTAELGEVTTAGAPIASLVDLNHIWLRVYVPESLYGRLSLGQAAQVSVDSYPGQVFHGKVQEIASEAEFTPRNVQTQEERVKLVFGVKIALDNQDHRLKPGMPADAVLALPQSPANE